MYSEKSFTSTINVKYLPRDTPPPDFHRWEIRPNFCAQSCLHRLRRLSYCYHLAPGIQGIQKIQVNWFHLCVRIVHLLHADVFDPTVHAGTMDEKVRVNRIRVLY